MDPERNSEMTAAQANTLFAGLVETLRQKIHLSHA